MFLPDVKMLAWPALAAATAVASVWCWRLPQTDLGLSVSPSATDQVRIAWRRDSAPALLASSGALDIEDGGTHRSVVLSAEQLRQGSLTYLRESPAVNVRLSVNGTNQWARLKPSSASASFHGGPPTRAQSTPTPVVAAASPPEVEIFRPVQRPLVSEEPPRAGSDRDRAERRQAVIPQVIPGARVETASITVPAAPPITVPQPAVAQLPINMPAPSPPVSPAVSRPAYNGPRTGRMIWTGSMARRGVVEIEGSHASIGTLSGALPGVPVAIRISPAEFSPQGLLVYSADAAVNGRREAASAENGWNATQFRWEPDRARELVLLEAPNPANEYKRLALRNDARTCSVIIVEWSVR